MKKQRSGNVCVDNGHNGNRARRELKIAAPSGLSYFPFQEQGIRFAIEHPNCLIADEMGLGKTVQAIGLVNSLPEIKTVLIVCPASLKINWLREWERWSTRSGLPVGIADSEFPDTDVVILSYEALNRFFEHVHARYWDLLIADESHKLKNDQAQRTINLLGKRCWNRNAGRWETEVWPVYAKRKLFLTGTPLLNRPCELWTTVRALDPQGLGSRKGYFEERYCDAGWGDYGWDKSGASNLKELAQRMSAFTIRRTKAQVLNQLPDKRLQVVVLDTPDTLKALVEEEKAEYQKAVLKGVRVLFTAMTKVRKRVAIAKAAYVIEHLRTLLESEQKVVCMAHHHDVIDLIADAFGSDAVVFDGRSNQRYRQAMADRFQNDPSCSLFIGGIQVAGTGINLTAASVIVFAELDWTPGTLSQAEDRIHRIGQANRVLVQHIVLDNSLDANLVRKLTKKQRIISTVTAGICVNG